MPPSPSTPRSSPIRAAGGVIERSGQNGVEVALVHRPRYDDWTFPKGKLAPGETDEEGAIREVLEETGMRVRIGPEIGTRRYQDRHGRDKTVRYWRMVPEGGRFIQSDEVDRLEWLTTDEALQRLTYQGDRALLKALVGRSGQSTNL